MVGEELDTLQEKVNWHWRNTMRPVRFLAFDARAALPLPLLLVHFSQTINIKQKYCRIIYL